MSTTRAAAAASPPLLLLLALLAGLKLSAAVALANEGAIVGGGDEEVSPPPEGYGEAETKATAVARAWANAAFDYVKALNCDDVVFTSHRECLLLRALQRRDCVVYTAGEAGTPGERLHVVLTPDESVGGRAASHDGVLVLDPHPDANFGHLVVVFYVDRQTDAAACRRQGRIYAGRNHCMTLALKSRCRNAIESRNRGVYAAAAAGNSVESRRPRKYSKRCEINFLPLVYQSSSSAAVNSAGRSDASAASETERTQELASAGAPPSRLQQMLSCRDDLPGYSPCPTRRPFNESREPACDPLRDNTRRCETSHELVRTRCRLFESCDQAVLISGGWSRQHSLQHHWDGLAAAYRMLRSNGFHRDTVKVFYANGASDGLPGVDGEERAEVFPASSKLALRSHIKKMCESPHCVDTLVLYLNSPAKIDGSMLLWDVDGDGLADDSERYLVEELLADLASCMARHVLVLADQSFSGEIAKAFRRSQHDHGNVVVYASGREHEYSYGNEFTLKWTEFPHHAHTCANDVFQHIKATMLHSSPESGEAQRSGGSSSRVTIFGAPCDVDPPFTQRELRVYYRGCQNVPTEVWWHRYFQLASQRRGGAAAPAAAQALSEPPIPVYRPETLPEPGTAAGTKNK